MQVVIDSNIIYNDPRLSRLYFRIVRRQASRGDFSLVFPEVVVRECVSKFAERAEKAYSGMVKQETELTRLGLPSPIPSEAARVAQREEYEALLRRLCQEPGCEIAAIPEADHDRLVDRAVAKTKPFNAEGAGYRDALIWETVAECADAGPVAFITDNHQDFGDSEDHSHVAPDLADDLIARGLQPDTVTIYPDLGSFIDVHVARADRAFHHVADRTARDDDFRALLFDKVSNAAQDFSLMSESWRLDLPDEAESPQVAWFEPDEVTVTDAHELDDGTVGVDFSVWGEADIDCYVPKWAAYSDDANITIQDADWNEWYVWAYAHRRLVLDMTADYDEESGEISEVEIEDVRAPGIDA